ncbi:unnamed protein product [Trichogramma brassicae]|uniref:Uncharacterized protein n=1 Tax=Trichogramma brassicae TaxID=86971 RepID=A0A6H5I2N5_9HYME|nr:unnamed protein product [Trichogramma brassicae]
MDRVERRSLREGRAREREKRESSGAGARARSCFLILCVKGSRSACFAGGASKLVFSSSTWSVGGATLAAAAAAAADDDDDDDSRTSRAAVSTTSQRLLRAAAIACLYIILGTGSQLSVIERLVVTSVRSATRIRNSIAVFSMQCLCIDVCAKFVGSRCAKAKIPKVATLAMVRRILRRQQQQQQQQLKYKAPIWNPGNNEQFHRLTRLHYIHAGTQQSKVNAYRLEQIYTLCIADKIAAASPFAHQYTAYIVAVVYAV